jgi:hypothetical protein
MLIPEPFGIRIHEADYTVVEGWSQANVMDEADGEASPGSDNADFHLAHDKFSFSYDC